jgi:RNA polymerase sigma-70 factor (ECF subfamily)
VTDPFDGTRLADALRTGQPDQLRAAFHRHFDAMILLAGSLTHGSKEETERLLQVLWTSVVPDYARAAPRGSARAWLFARLLDLCGPVADDAEAAHDADEEFLPEDDPWEGHWTEFPAHWRSGPDAWERSPEGGAVIEAAIAALPLEERVVLLLRDLDGWTPSEVTGLTGLTPDEERDVLFRARLKIRDVIDPMVRVETPAIAIPREAGRPGDG